VKMKAEGAGVVGSWVLHSKRDFDDEMAYHQDAAQDL